MRDQYVHFRCGDAQGTCVTELESHLDFFLRKFDEWLTAQPKKIYLERPNLVAGLRLPPAVRGTESPSDLPVVLKRFGWRSPLHRMASPLSESKALRSFRIAVILRRAGVPTPRPLIAWERRRWGIVTASYYITEEIRNSTTFRAFSQTSAGSGPEMKPRLTRLARLVRGMHDAGILHRDLTLGNFLVTTKPTEGNGPYLIDLSRAVHLGRVPLLLRFIDLARMKLLDHWPEFFEAYCKGRAEWKRRAPLLRALVWWRRRRMDLWKRLKV